MSTTSKTGRSRLFFDRPVLMAGGLLLTLATVSCRPGEVGTRSGQLRQAHDITPDERGLWRPETLIPGDRDKILLIGTVLTPDRVLEDAEVLVVGRKIVCVGYGCHEGANAEAANAATVIPTGGIITPGLIDSHNHPSYNAVQAWHPSCYDNLLTDTPGCGYGFRREWGTSEVYKDNVTRPQTFVRSGAGCEMNKWSEFQALVAGTVAQQNAGSDACTNGLVRGLDGHNGLGGDVNDDDVFPLGSGTNPSSCESDTASEHNDLESGEVWAYYVHVGEGLPSNGPASGEFGIFDSCDALVSGYDSRTGTVSSSASGGTVIIHGTAFGSSDFARMAQVGAKLVWSPVSNMTLYGATADVNAALAAGVHVALGPDWVHSGSQNLLDEMNYIYTQSGRYSWTLSAAQILSMATYEGAFAAGFDQRVGRVERGYVADLSVFAARGADPYVDVVTADPGDVRLVLIDGVALFGDRELMAPFAYAECDQLWGEAGLCGVEKTVCVADPSRPSAGHDQTLADVQGVLEARMVAWNNASNQGQRPLVLQPLVPAGSCR